MPISVFLIDDQPIFVDGIRTILAARPNEFTVVGKITHSKEALQAATTLKPDVILLDIDMPHKNGIEVLKEIKAFASEVWKPMVIMLSLHEQTRYINDAIAAGARGYLVKGAIGENEVLDAIRTVAAGRKYFCPVSKAVRQVLEDEPEAGGSRLTTRQLDIVKLVAQGKTSREIANELNCAQSTVENHRLAAMKKLNVSNAAELAIYVHNQGW